MNFKWITEDGRAHAINNEVAKIVIYGHGVKLFERELSMEAYEIKQNKNGEDKLCELYHAAPIAVTLHGEVKTARKENLNRKDNYTLTYSPEYLKWERRTCLYIHESEIAVTDLGDVLSMETAEEKNYLHAVKLHFNGETTYQRFHAEFMQVGDDWKIPDGGRWSNSYGTPERPCYDTYDFTNSPFEKSRAKGKGVVKRYCTVETLDAGAEIIAAECYYTRTEESADRKRKRAIADKLNASKEYSNKEWSHYDITRLEKALGYQLTI